MSSDEKIWPLRIPRELVTSSIFQEFTQSDWRLYMTLSLFENRRSHQCWPSYPKIQKISNLGRSVISRASRHLQALDAIRIRKEPGRRNVYEIRQSFPLTSPKNKDGFPLKRRKKDPSGRYLSSQSQRNLSSQSQRTSPKTMDGNSYKEPMKGTWSPLPPTAASSPPSEVGSVAGGKQEETAFNKFLLQREKQKTDRAVPKGPDTNESAFKNLAEQLAPRSRARRKT